MRVIGIMLVDLSSSALGLPSRAASDLAGRSILRRSVGRALAAKNLDQVVVLAPADQHGSIRALLGDLASDPRLAVSSLPAGRDAAFGRFDPDFVRQARRWALSCWRGGISGSCWFDELLAPRAMSGLARELKADAVALLSPDAPLADAALIDAIVEQHRGHHADYRLAFSQAAPGLGTVCLGAGLLADLDAAGQSIGRAIAYDPATPQPDLVATEATVKLPIDVIACPHRFLADTARGVALIERVIRDLGDSPTVEQTTRAVNAIFEAEPEPWPREIDLELTTERTVADVLRPGRPLVPVRGLVEDRVVARVCEFIAKAGIDDLVITLGGFGDALLHPRVPEIASELKSAGALAVAIRTSGVGLTEPMVARLLGSQVGVVVVELDAATRESYQRLKGADAFDAVTAGMKRVLSERARLGRPGPLLVAEMVKCPATLAEMEEFFDRWRFADEAHLAGLHEYGGQFQSPAGPGWTMAPPKRRSCVRLDRRLAVLADGTVPLCDLDIKAASLIGRLDEWPLDDTWLGRPLADARSAHRRGRLDDQPLCRLCDQWNRP